VAGSVAAALGWARSQRSRCVADLRRFASFASVAADAAYAVKLRGAAAWLASYLAGLGLEHARVLPTAGHPVVYADWLHAPGRPTLLIYGHYDVQPADPLAEWHSPPFEPTLRGDRLYARGITDDKGQLLAHVFAVAAFLGATRSLPVNVRVVVEGEEEIGSPHFGAFVDVHRKLLACDAAVASDTPMLGPLRPALTHALRGGLSLEVEVSGQRIDLHSGLFGGAVHNSLEALCTLMASLYAPSGAVAVAGFYDHVRNWSEAERRYMTRFGPSDGEILRAAGADAAWGEPGFTSYERVTIRPSLTVTGVSGGYQGPGAKAVIPASAGAKLNARLVPDQNPADVHQKLLAHLRQYAPSTVRVCLNPQSSTVVPPVLLDRSNRLTRAAADACQRAFGAPVAYLRNGGTIGGVAELHQRLRVPIVLMGFALPDARLHAPNENLHLPTFFRSIDACIWLLAHARALRP
jgi:acetylornithine deacetylase/succinyl-diaminopimelate desuccinylase-like protein